MVLYLLYCIALHCIALFEFRIHHLWFCSLIIYPRSFRPVLALAVGFLDAIALLACSAAAAAAASHVGDHAVDSEWVGCVFLELDGPVSCLVMG